MKWRPACPTSALRAPPGSTGGVQQRHQEGGQWRGPKIWKGTPSPDRIPTAVPGPDLAKGHRARHRLASGGEELGRGHPGLGQGGRGRGRSRWAPKTCQVPTSGHQHAQAPPCHPCLPQGVRGHRRSSPEPSPILWLRKLRPRALPFLEPQARGSWARLQIVSRVPRVGSRLTQEGRVPGTPEGIGGAEPGGLGAF